MQHGAAEASPGTQHPKQHPNAGKVWGRPFLPGVSGNPDGKTSFRSRYNAKVAAFTADLGHEPSAMELELIRQAALMSARAEELRRAAERGKLVKDEDLSRLSNGCARILLRLRDGRQGREQSEHRESLHEYAARVTREKRGDAA
jgi:hypothetical protein